MKFGKLSPEPCPFDYLEEDDYFPVLEFSGSCPNCKGGTGQFPAVIWGVYLRTEGIYHVFVPMHEVHCAGCGGIMVQMAVHCGKINIDVTKEFQDAR